MSSEKNELGSQSDKISLKNKLGATGLFLLSLGIIASGFIHGERSSVRDKIKKGTGIPLKKEAPKNQDAEIINQEGSVGDASVDETKTEVKPFDELKKMSQKELFRYFDQVNATGKAEMEKCFRESLSHAIKTLLATPEIDFFEYLTEYQVPGNCFAHEVTFEEREEAWDFCKEQVLGVIINDRCCLEEVNRKLASLGLTLKDLAVGIRLKMKN